MSVLAASEEEPSTATTTTTTAATETTPSTTSSTTAESPSPSEATTAAPSLPDGFQKQDGEWLLYENGSVRKDYNGIVEGTIDGTKGWWRVVEGKADLTCNTVEQNEHGWWKCKDGKVDFTYTGIAENRHGWWRIVNGKVNFQCNTVEQNEYGWWKCKNGKVDFHYTGVAQNQYGWWRIENGKVNFRFSGLAQNEYGWWKLENGKVNFKSTGITENPYGFWYVKNGKVRFDYSGSVNDKGNSYTVTNGKVSGARLSVPSVSQTPGYPTGCEAASAAAFLRYYGYSVTVSELVNAIPRQNLYWENGRKYGPSITEKFVGDPRYTYTSSTPGYGAFSPVVTKAVNNVIASHGGNQKAVNVTGTSADDLTRYLNLGKPLIIWATYNMNTPYTVNEWYIKTSSGDQYFSYPRGTHVMVLIGYTSSTITVMDPYGGSVKTFSRSAFNSKYQLLGQQAIVMN